MSKITTSLVVRQITQPQVRVRSSEGEASMLCPMLNAAGELELVELENDLEKKWVPLPVGALVTKLSGVEKTDTWCLALMLPLPTGGYTAPRGFVLRRASWEKVMANSVQFTGGIPSTDMVHTPAPAAESPKAVAEEPRTGLLGQLLSGEIPVSQPEPELEVAAPPAEIQESTEEVQAPSAEDIDDLLNS